MSEKKYPVKRKGEYTLKIQRLAFGGAGVARVENYVVFVKDTLPGEKVRARIIRRRSAYAEARLLEILEPSPMRQEPSCKYHQWCGGCTWQNLAYENQLKFKEDIVRESLRHIAGIQGVDVLSILASEQVFGYRNKMEFSFADRRWLLPHELNESVTPDKFALGLHVPGSFDKVLHIDYCYLQSEFANEALKYISKYCQSNNLQPYGIKSHEGFLRFLVIRQSHYSGKLMVNLVTAYEDQKKLMPLAEGLISQFPEIESVVNNINSRLAQIAQGEKEIILAGKDFIQEKLGDFTFNISANSFFQTNTGQARVMYEKVLEFAGLSGNEIIWDLYCGTGAFSLFLSAEAKTVTGFEVVSSAVQDAIENARNHRVNNANFIEGDLLVTMKSVSEEPDVIVTDPPRAGMHEKVVRSILNIAPQRIVYVSCNPTTLARDLAILAEQYVINKVQPLDMFPQTYHIETIVQLSRREV